jgi:hypothetical protein
VTGAHQAQQTLPPPVRTPDIFWVPTPDAVVTGMLKLANVGKNDVVYDLGCGDGKIVILGDIFDPNVKISDATVVTLYLLPTLNEKLAPRLRAELQPGTRIVSHSFEMGTWKPDKSQEIDGKQIHLWFVPKR